MDVPSSASISGLKSVSCWLSWAYTSRLENWALGRGACDYTHLGGKLLIWELWAPSLSPGDAGGILGRGGVSSSVSCLCWSGVGATVHLGLPPVSIFIAVLFWQGRHSSMWFWWSLTGCLSIAAFIEVCPGDSTPCFISSWASARGSLIR